MRLIETEKLKKIVAEEGKVIVVKELEPFVETDSEGNEIEISEKIPMTIVYVPLSFTEKEMYEQYEEIDM